MRNPFHTSLLFVAVCSRWSKSKVEDAWLDSEDAARKAAGVPRAASTKPPPGTMIEDEVQLGDSFPIEDCVSTIR